MFLTLSHTQSVFDHTTVPLYTQSVHSHTKGNFFFYHCLSPKALLATFYCWLVRVSLLITGKGTEHSMPWQFYDN